MDELESLTRDLVATPAHDDEAAVGDRIESWLREHTDATVTRDDAPNGGNVIARRGDGDESLALVGHHDVVAPAQSQVADDGTYRIEERDGRLHGRGTADMTGALAAMLLAFRETDPAGELVFASFVGEEDGGVGARHAIERDVAPDYAVVGEGSTGYSGPSTVDVAVAHKGRRASTLRASGTAAHASEPETGENAVYRACDAVDVVRDLDTPATEVLGHRLVGSLVVTEIDGGDAWNVVPDACEVTIDERTVPGDRAALDRATEVEGVSWDVEQDLPPMACDDAAFADAALDAVAGAQDATPEQVVKPHATDAGWLADAGTTCVVCGPAEPGEAHTDAESVSLDALRTCRDAYLEIAARWP
ncbi:acetylornithine deacetylase [Halarchaeum rubridurum]|uniref:Acetylornithine deacetylase n=1 Tax=Halarchaeum rubridurum TaxID=489911 RepID=A0A830G0Z2_9EURY|nr:M20/M25/M40 family metallo-hydrolase [Halarchaeum rubridurum]MBP1954961.1 acetylornithine deacetylase [Halarchaeum rubridurum]GGM70101.1 acetylornithine deacetylase [Halarchaeum rubridurum]